VAVACSFTLGRVSPRQNFRLSFHFGLFQAMMPVLGWLAGQSARQYIESWDHWAAFGLLAFVGGKAIYEALCEQEDELNPSDPTRGMSLVLFSVATSIDALAVGLSLSLVGVNILFPALVIGIVTAAITCTGMLLGSRIGERLGSRLEIFGGLVLIGIGVKILLSHLV
jgi:putative Mn2+ efflux pump MntP